MEPYRFMEVSMACTNVQAFPGPDNLWIELNEVHEPPDAQWFPA